MAIFPAFALAAETTSSFFITSDGVRLHYLETGKGTAIVFVPGWTMPAWIWSLQIQYFAKNFHVVALDPRAQGDSEKVNFGNYTRRLCLNLPDTVAGTTSQVMTCRFHRHQSKHIRTNPFGRSNLGACREKAENALSAGNQKPHR